MSTIVYCETAVTVVGQFPACDTGWIIEQYTPGAIENLLAWDFQAFELGLSGPLGFWLIGLTVGFIGRLLRSIKP